MEREYLAHKHASDIDYQADWAVFIAQNPITKTALIGWCSSIIPIDGIVCCSGACEHDVGGEG